MLIIKYILYKLILKTNPPINSKIDVSALDQLIEGMFSKIWT